MIYDFGCGTPNTSLGILMRAFIGCASILGVTAGLATLGSFLQPNKNNFKPVDIFCGWGIVAALMTLSSVFFGQSLLWAAAVLAFCMLFFTVRAAKNGYFCSFFWLLALFPGLLILMALNLIGIFGWDAYAQWIPNALYLFNHSGLPTQAAPAIYSSHASYPYALPFLTYLASVLAGGFLMQGSALFSFIFLLAFATALPDIARHMKGGVPAPASEESSFLSDLGLASFALVVITLLNPGFSASLTLTNYSDGPTMVLTGLLAIKLWELTGYIQCQNRVQINTVSFEICLMAAAFILIKQINFILYGLLLFSFATVAWKNRILRKSSLQIFYMFIPVMVLKFVWAYYAHTEIGDSDFSVLPFKAWRFDLIPSLLNAMLREMAHKTGLFGLAVAIVIAGIVALSKPATRWGDFALIAAMTCAGYIAILFIAYIGSTFSDEEIRQAASFYRYATHIALVEITFIWISALCFYHRYAEKFIALPFFPKPRAAPLLAIIFLISLLPLVLLADKRLLLRGSEKEACADRATAQRVMNALPEATRLAVIEPQDSGFLGLALNLEFALAEHGQSHPDRLVQDVTLSNPLSDKEIRDDLVKGNKADALLIYHSPEKSAVFSYGAADLDKNSDTPMLVKKNSSGEWVRVPF